MVQKKNGHHGSAPVSIASSAPTAGSSASRKPSRTASTGRRYPENIEENAPIGSGRRSCDEPRSTFGSPAESRRRHAPAFSPYRGSSIAKVASASIGGYPRPS